MSLKISLPSVAHRDCLGSCGLLRLPSGLVRKVQGPFGDVFQAERKSRVFAVPAVFTGVPLS